MARPLNQELVAVFKADSESHRRAEKSALDDFPRPAGVKRHLECLRSQERLDRGAGCVGVRCGRRYALAEHDALAVVADPMSELSCWSI